MLAFTIETERLILRRLRIDDYRRLFENCSQQEAMNYLGLTSEEAYWTCRKKYEEGMQTYRIRYEVFQLLHKDERRVMGDCGFHTWFPDHFRAEIGYGLIQEADRRKGYMTEAIREVLNYGFTVMNLNRVEALIAPGNIASLKVIESMGFKQEGILREHYFTNNRLEDSVLFALLKSEFRKENN